RPGQGYKIHDEVRGRWTHGAVSVMIHNREMPAAQAPPTITLIDFQNKHTAAVKIALGILFLVLALVIFPGQKMLG
ncbi:MAG: hypothetical protein NTV46_11000, partial [Verrucomicrobia bacterium]|nr:hypothetical protein [Verrucomicrobiota bacterium]